PAAVPSTSARSGLSENAAAFLSYALGWITGIIFFLLDRRPMVRFHAAQSIVTFGGLHILRILLGMAFGVGWCVVLVPERFRAGATTARETHRFHRRLPGLHGFL